MRHLLMFAAALAALSPALASEATLRLDDLTTTRERPLFTPGRRPPSPVAAPAETIAPPPPVLVAAPEAAPFEMVGAAVGGVRSFVLLRRRGTGEVIRVRAGDSVEGWRVGAVALRTVALERDGRVETVGIVSPSLTAPPTPLAEAAPALSPEPDNGEFAAARRHRPER